MANKSVKLSGPVFLSPTNMHYRMYALYNNNCRYEFPILNSKETNDNSNKTGHVLKRKK